MIPKCVNIRIANTSPASQTTAKKAQLIRIKDEIKFLYKKKEKLKWGSTWCIIQNSRQDALSREMEKKYKSMDDKINKLTQSQTKKTNNHI
jgi:hypothetical protein